MIELGNDYEVGNGQCVLSHSRQYRYIRVGEAILAPPVEELGEVDGKYVIGTDEVLPFPQKEVWKPKQRNASGSQMSGRKSDIAIVSKKPVKAEGEKGCALDSFKQLRTMQTKES